MILASGEAAQELGIEPLARVVSSAVYALDPLVMGIAPAWALPMALKRAGLTPDEIDVWEIHEAFSAQALGVLRELPNQLDGFVVPDEKLTPNGGAVAIGHPFGATGTRYLLTLALELRERNVRHGAVGVCIGSGKLSLSFSRIPAHPPACWPRSTGTQAQRTEPQRKPSNSSRPGRQLHRQQLARVDRTHR